MKYLGLTTFTFLLLISPTISKVLGYSDEASVENANLPTDNSSNTSALNSLEARILINNQDVKQGAASSFRVHSVLIIPTIIFKTFGLVPGAAGAVIAHPSIRTPKNNDTSSANCTDLNIRGVPHGMTVDKRSYCCFFNSCYWCSSGAGLRPPQVFAFPVLIFSALGALPRAVASAIQVPFAKSDLLPNPRDLTTAFSLSQDLKCVEDAVEDIMDLVLHHKERRDGVKGKDLLGFESTSLLKLRRKLRAGVECWEDKLKGAWASVMGIAVLFATGL